MAGFMPDEAVIAGIRKELEAYEQARQAASRSTRWRVPLFLGLLFLAVVLLAYLLNALADPNEQWLSTLHVYLYAGAFVAALFLYFRARKPAEATRASLRARLLPIVFGFIGDMRFAKGGTPASFDKLPRDTVGDFDHSQFDDIISGTYEGFAFELYETVLSRTGKGAATLFDGVIVAFEMQQAFPGELIATLKSNAVMGFFREIFGGGMVEIASGVPELDAAYDFRTDNADAAQPLVSGQVAQALTWLKEAWPGEPARIAIKDRNGYLLLPAKKDFFELPLPDAAIDYKTHVEPMIADLATMLAITALVRKIGA